MKWIDVNEELPEYFEDVMIWCRLKYRKDFERFDATYNRSEGIDDEGEEWLIDGDEKVKEVKYFCRYPEDPE